MGTLRIEESLLHTREKEATYRARSFHNHFLLLCRTKISLMADYIQASTSILYSLKHFRGLKEGSKEGSVYIQAMQEHYQMEG